MSGTNHRVSIARAAELLGIDRQTVRRRMEDKSLNIGFVLPGKKRNTYVITVEKFEELTGIKI